MFLSIYFGTFVPKLERKNIIDYLQRLLNEVKVITPTSSDKILSKYLH